MEELSPESTCCSGSNSFTLNNNLGDNTSFTQQRCLRGKARGLWPHSRRPRPPFVTFLSQRQRNSCSSLSFNTTGKSHASKITELTGFTDNYFSGKGSDGNMSSHYDFGSLIQQEADKASTRRIDRERTKMVV